VAGAAIRRLAKRPQGVTNAEAAQATELSARQAGSRLAQMTRSNVLRKTPGKPTRWFLV
jgi:predicted HTH transcriptional regulator